MAYSGRGSVYFQTNRYDLAIADFTKLIELNPGYAGAYNGRGTVYFQTNRYDLAIADFTKLIELNPGSVEAYMMRGMIYLITKQYDPAVKDFTKFIELAGEVGEAYNSRGLVYLRGGQYDLAIKDFTKAMGINPKDATAHHYLFLAYHRKGNKALAKNQLLKASEIDPEIIKNSAGCLEDMRLPGAFKEFCAEDILALSEYMTVEENLIALAKGILSEAATSPYAPRPAVKESAAVDIRTVPDFKSEPRPNDLAVVIGIENYQGLPKSDYSKSDAGLMKDYLKALGLQERNIQYITDERATLSGIIKSLEAWLKNRAKPDSRVFVYYSGHGAPEPKTGGAYIVPYDGDPNYLEVTGYPLKRLYDNLGKLQAAEVVVVLDSCFSGAGGRSVLAKGSRPLVMTTETAVLSSHMAVLTSAQGTQISSSSPEKGHGIFTYYFLEALKGGKTTLAEIYEYIKPLVENEAKELNAEQSPGISPEPEKHKGKFVLRK